MRSVGILGTGSYVPERIITNADLETWVDTTDEWIISRTGIRERRMAHPAQASSDLAVEAASIALKASKLTPDEIDLVIVCTVTPDHIFPATSCLVQASLGINKAATFDLSVACTGFLYGVATAEQFIKTGMYNYALVIGVDCLTRLTDFTDRNTCVLFGDGAGAVVLGPVDQGYGFLGHKLRGDGTHSHFLEIPAGGSRQPTSFVTVEKGLHTIDMDGKAVFRFAVQVMVAIIEDVLDYTKIHKDDINFLVPHQANIRIIKSALRRFGWQEDKTIINLDRYGNMSAASVPVALDELIRSKRVKDGHNIVLCAFGAGLTWGASVLRWFGLEGDD